MGEAWEALWRMGEPAHAEIERMSRSDNPHLRVFVAHGLAQMDWSFTFHSEDVGEPSDDDFAIGLLSRLSHDPNDEVAEDAAKGLLERSRNERAPDRVGPQLRALADDPRAQVRRYWETYRAERARRNRSGARPGRPPDDD